MDPVLRKVVEVPLRELWDDRGVVPARMVRDELTEAEVKEHLRAGPVQFVFAPFGGKLEWVPLDERFDFWKNTVQPILTQWEPDGRVYTDDFPRGFVIASLWEIDSSDAPVILATLYD